MKLVFVYEKFIFLFFICFIKKCLNLGVNQILGVILVTLTLTFELFQKVNNLWTIQTNDNHLTVKLTLI